MKYEEFHFEKRELEEGVDYGSDLEEIAREWTHWQTDAKFSHGGLEFRAMENAIQAANNWIPKQSLLKECYHAPKYRDAYYIRRRIEYYNAIVDKSSNKRTFIRKHMREENGELMNETAKMVERQLLQAVLPGLVRNMIESETDKKRDKKKDRSILTTEHVWDSDKLVMLQKMRAVEMISIYQKFLLNRKGNWNGDIHDERNIHPSIPARPGFENNYKLEEGLKYWDTTLYSMQAVNLGLSYAEVSQAMRWYKGHTIMIKKVPQVESLVSSERTQQVHDTAETDQYNDYSEQSPVEITNLEEQTYVSDNAQNNREELNEIFKSSSEDEEERDRRKHQKAKDSGTPSSAKRIYEASTHSNKESDRKRSRFSPPRDRSRDRKV